MSFPYQISFFGAPFYLHFIFETLAFIVGVRLYYYIKKDIADPISDMNRLWKLGVKLLIASRVFFLIGFGTCLALIKIG